MSQTPTPEQIIASLRMEVEDLRSSRDRCLEKLSRWLVEMEAVNELCDKTIGAPMGTPLKTRVERIIAWARALDRDRLDNLSRWKELIQCGLSVDQPELLIFIDEALRERVQLQHALAFMLNNVGNPVCQGTRKRFQEAQELVPATVRQDPRNARVEDSCAGTC